MPATTTTRLPPELQARLGALAQQTGRSAHSLIIEVTDDGPGIPKEWQEAIFLPFRTVPDRSTADGMSSGIGLALVHRTAEALGAKISVTSAALERRGTKFMFEWPLVLNS